MDHTTPLYSSRIIKTYLEYIARHYPDIDPAPLLSGSGITRHEVDDPSHFLTQEQINRFHECLNARTGNPDISREVGRYTASAEAFGIIKTQILGLVEPSVMYSIVAKTMNRMARNCSIVARRKGPNRMEVLDGHDQPQATMAQ